MVLRINKEMFFFSFCNHRNRKG